MHTLIKTKYEVLVLLFTINIIHMSPYIVPDHNNVVHHLYPKVLCKTEQRSHVQLDGKITKCSSLETKAVW